MDANLLLSVGTAALFIALTGFFVFAVRHQDEIEPREEPVYGVELLRQHYAPGATIEQPTPYYVAPIPVAPDPLEIAGNLDKKVFAGVAMLGALFLMTGAYFVIMPTVQAHGAEVQLEQRVHRGQSIYANLCYDCHGKNGEGINGAGLPLNQPGNKYDQLATDPTKLKDRETLLRLTVERGRAKPPGTLSMPAWARSEGGPLNPEQVNQILSFIEHATDAEWADVVQVRKEAELALEPQTPKPPSLPTGATGGKQLVANNPQQSCTTCHSFTKGTASTLPQAPNLSNYGNEGPINAELKALKARDADWLLKWVSNAPSIKPGIAMPTFSDKSGGKLSDDNLKQIVEYLTSLGTPSEPK